MTWRDDLRRVNIGGRLLIGASFRGVPFFVDGAERAGGRRTVSHEFPLRDDPFVEDLGRRARVFHIDGYVIGDDYLAQRDALLAALEDVSGPGELVHPYHGVRRAICVNVSVKESRNEGGTAAFTIEFAETPTQAPVPTEVVDAASKVSTRADAALKATQIELEEQFDIAGLPSFALESAETALTKATTALNGKLAPIVTDTQELAEFTGRIAVLTAEAASLVRHPDSVLDDFRAAITGLTVTIAAAPGAVMNALLDAYGDDLGSPVDPITTTREQELTNQTAMIAGLRRVIACEAARLAPVVPYTTTEEAAEARDRVAIAIGEQAAEASDTAYPALVDLRSEVLRSVPGGTQFARVVPVVRNEPIPSLLLTYQLYGSVDLELDVVTRNRIRHPGFIAGDLRVLSDE